MRGTRIPPAVRNMVRDGASFASSLALWFESSLETLPSDLQKLIRKRFPSFADWNKLQPSQRRSVVSSWDAANPTRLTDAVSLEKGGRYGFRKVASSWQNRRNAKRPRISTQRVTDEAILRAHSIVKEMGIPFHKRCSAAFKYIAPPVTSRAFRMRWNRLGLNKKGS